MKSSLLTIASDTSTQEEPSEQALARLLAVEHSRAERMLNILRLVVVGVLTVAAAVYAPALPPVLRHANAAVLAPILAWSLFQIHLVHARHGIYPWWLSAASPLVDATAVTAIILCYGLIGSPAVALKAPITLVYFAILAARPIIGSARAAAITAGTIAVEYAVALFVLTRATEVALWVDPITAAGSANISLLDEGMKLVLLIVAGTVATYATAWHERVLRRALSAQVERDAEERELAMRLQEADKLAALGTLAASIAHEVNNPLAAIALSAELLSRTLTDPADRDEAAAIAGDAHRTAAVVKELLAFARRGESDAGPVAMGELVERSLSTLRHLLRDRMVTVEQDIAPDLPLLNGDAAALERVVVNLVINAAQAMEAQHDRRVVRVRLAAEEQGLSLTVEDTGPGFAPGAAEHLFDRFFTTKPAGKGTGLGLWMVAQVVERHAGTITAADTGSGARFTVRLPLQSAAAAA